MGAIWPPRKSNIDDMMHLILLSVKQRRSARGRALPHKPLDRVRGAIRPKQCSRCTKKSHRRVTWHVQLALHCPETAAEARSHVPLRLPDHAVERDSFSICGNWMDVRLPEIETGA